VADLLFRPATSSDVEELLADLRPADRDEAEALLGEGKADDAIRDSLRASIMAWAAEDDEGVVFVFGLATGSMLNAEAAPWMVGTTRTERYPRELVRQARPYIARMLKAAPLLCNAVDARNVRAIRWLKRIGFNILAPMPLGAAGLPFHPFYMDA
jgi:hypothetical protein